MFDIIFFILGLIPILGALLYDGPKHKKICYWLLAILEDGLLLLIFNTYYAALTCA